jgi:hypothetical protein
VHWNRLGAVAAAWTLLSAMPPAPAPALAQAAGSEARPGGRIWGYVFGDYYHKVSGDTALWGETQYAGVARGARAAQLRRLYLGYDHDFADAFGASVLLESNERSTFANGNYGVFLKQAYVRWRSRSPLLTVQAGLVPTPAFAVVERTWGYRSVEKSTLDLRGLGRSSGQGIGVTGATGDGGVGYHVLLASGAGTQAVARGDGVVYGSVWGRWLDGRLVVELLALHADLGEDGRRRLGRLFVGHAADAVTAGVELVAARETGPDPGGAATRVARDAAAVSVMAALDLDPAVPATRAFLRWDRYDADRSASAPTPPARPAHGFAEHLWIAGIDVRPDARVQIMPNIWIATYDAQHPAAVPREADVILRLTLFFRF